MLLGVIMASKFHKNVVLTGSIDCYCLACDSHLRCRKDASSHIEKPIHKKNLESVHYLDKYKDDHIRKVKKGYFCEYCNILLQTTAKVSLHIAEQKHNNNKGTQLVKRLGNSIILPNDVLISETAWNGFIDETCAVCNTEFYSDHIHKTEQKHILNLIQKEIQFGFDNAIYRNVDESSFQCLTCNMIFALSSITTHSKDENHKIAYAKCHELKPPIFSLLDDKKSLKENISPAANNIPANSKKTGTDDIIRYIPTTQKNKKTDINVTCNKMKNEQKDKDFKTIEANKLTTNLFNRPTTDSTVAEDKIITHQIKNSINVNFNKSVFELPNNKTDKHVKADQIASKKNTNNANEYAAFFDWNKNQAVAKNQNTDTAKTSLATSDINTINNANDHGAFFDWNKNQAVAENQNTKNSKKPRAASEIVVKNSQKKTKAIAAKTEIKLNEAKNRKKPRRKGFLVNKKKWKANPANITSSNSIKHQSLIESFETKPTKSQKENKHAVFLAKPDATKEIGAKTKFDYLNERRDTNKNEEVLDKVSDYQKNGININFEMCTAFCKKCFGNVNMDCDAIENHIYEHKNDTENKKLSFTEVLNKNHNRTVLNEVQPGETTKNIDQKHNIPGSNNQKPSIINEDLESNRDCSLVKYVPKLPNKSDNQKTEEVKVHKETLPPQVAKQELKDPESFAKANKLTFNKGNKNAYCRLCATRIPSSLRNMTEHVNGSSHKTKAARVANIKPIIPKKPMGKFVKHTVEIGNKYCHDIIINDRLCLSRLSFWMITENNVTLRCQACEVNLTKNSLSQHFESYFHERAMESTPVVWNLDTEFIREVRPEIFHCGFCNLIVGCWEDVANHLKCEEHEEKRADACMRLQENLPAILEHRQRRERDFFSQLMEFF